MLWLLVSAALAAQQAPEPTDGGNSDASESPEAPVPAVVPEETEAVEATDAAAPADQSAVIPEPEQAEPEQAEPEQAEPEQPQPEDAAEGSEVTEGPVPAVAPIPTDSGAEKTEATGTPTAAPARNAPPKGDKPAAAKPGTAAEPVGPSETTAAAPGVEPAPAAPDATVVSPDPEAPIGPPPPVVVNWTQRKQEFDRRKLAFRELTPMRDEADRPPWVVIDGLGIPITATQLAERTRDDDTLSRLTREKRNADLTSKIVLITGLSALALTPVPLFLLEDGASARNADLGWTAVFIGVSGASIAALSPIHKNVQKHRNRQPAFLYSRSEAETRVGLHNRDLFRALDLASAPPPEAGEAATPEPDGKPTPETEAEKEARLEGEPTPQTESDGGEEAPEDTAAPDAKAGSAIDKAADDDLPEAGGAAPDTSEDAEAAEPVAAEPEAAPDTSEDAEAAEPEAAAPEAAAPKTAEPGADPAPATGDAQPDPDAVTPEPAAPAPTTPDAAEGGAQ